MDQPSAPLWERYRDQFPVCERFIYMNHASVAPLCRRAADAMKQLVDDVSLFGACHYDEWLTVYEGVRQAAARMIGADPREIALVKNTSEGIATVAGGLQWREGDAMVAFREEFAANFFPWRKLEQKGVKVRWLSIGDPLESIDEACREARLLAISFVQYLSGFRADLEAIGEICHRRGCLFFVDAIQGMGAFPIDVRKARIHALAADGHKWLLGPEGCGILYIQRDLQDFIEPVEFGWSNVAHYADFGSRDMTLRPDAGRYECGTLNTAGCYGLKAALEFLLEVGVERIAGAVQDLRDRIAEGAVARGYELLGERDSAHAAGIVSFRKAGVDNTNIIRRLRSAGVVCAPRQGWVRASPHFYLSPEDVGRMLDSLPV